MLDYTLRPVKEKVLHPICHLIPSAITPTHLTLVGFLLGLASCYTTAIANHDNATGTVGVVPLTLWLLNRLLDGLDGSLARSRKTATEAGGFIDLLCDFIVYSLIPIAVAHGQEGRRRSRSQGSEAVDCWRAVAFLEATFHINNFVLLYVAAVEAKITSRTRDDQGSNQLTSLLMRPALVEGVESGVLFTVMLAFPEYIGILAWTMGCAVVVGVVQRSIYTIRTLRKVDHGGHTVKADEELM